MKQVTEVSGKQRVTDKMELTGAVTWVPLLSYEW